MEGYCSSPSPLRAHGGLAPVQPGACTDFPSQTSPDPAAAFTPDTSLYGAAFVAEAPAALPRRWRYAGRPEGPSPSGSSEGPRSGAAPCCQGPTRRAPQEGFEPGADARPLKETLVLRRNATFGVLAPIGGGQRGGSAWGRAVQGGSAARHHAGPLSFGMETRGFHSPVLPGTALGCLRAVLAAHLTANSVLKAHCKEIPGMLLFRYRIKDLGGGPVA